MKRNEYTTAALPDAPPLMVTGEQTVDPHMIMFVVPVKIGGAVAFGIAFVGWMIGAWIGMANNVDGNGVLTIAFLPPILGVLAGLAVFLLISQKRMQPKYEKRINMDLNGDGYIGPPPTPSPQTVRLEITSRGGTRTSLWDTGVPLETARRFATAALRGDTSVRAMDAARVSRDDCEKIRQALFEYGWARWRNGYSNQGWELTDEGADVMRAVQSAKSFPTPPG